MRMSLVIESHCGHRICQNCPSLSPDSLYSIHSLNPVSISVLRTPPKATPAAVQSVKQKQRKPSTALVSRPALPVKPIKWKQREYNDKFQIIYKFLTNGVDAEDIMYLKKSYEMVNV